MITLGKMKVVKDFNRFSVAWGEKKLTYVGWGEKGGKKVNADGKKDCVLMTVRWGNRKGEMMMQENNLFVGPQTLRIEGAGLESSVGTSGLVLHELYTYILPIP